MKNFITINANAIKDTESDMVLIRVFGERGLSLSLLDEVGEDGSVYVGTSDAEIRLSDNIITDAIVITLSHDGDDATPVQCMDIVVSDMGGMFISTWY